MKNILMIVVDTLRPDHLGCYGYHRDTSPNLDRLAESSLVLESLWSASNFTAPAFTSLFTGKYPYEHGVFDFTSRVESSAIHEVMQINGVKTGGVVTFRFFRNLLKSIWGEIESVTDTRSFDYSKDLPLAVTASALAWLESRPTSQPFALFVHYDGPHMPYRLPEEYAARFDRVDVEKVDREVVRHLFPQDLEKLPGTGEAFTRTMFRLLEAVNWGRKKLDEPTLQWIQDKYDASVNYNDLAIGGLLDGLEGLGLADDTIVAVLSDHGEEFLEHGGISHSGINLHEEVIRTVGIIRNPGRTSPGRSLATPCSHVDIWPALLKMAGADNLPSGWDNPNVRTLVGLDAGGQSALQPVFCQGKAKVAVRAGNHKLIKAGPSPTLRFDARFRLWLKMMLQRKLGTEIYDLLGDPSEKRNLAGDRALKRRLSQMLSDFRERSTEMESPGSQLDEAERKRIEQEMKDLGYM